MQCERFESHKVVCGRCLRFYLELLEFDLFDNRVVFGYALVVIGVTVFEFKRRLHGLKSQHLFPVGSAA